MFRLFFWLWTNDPGAPAIPGVSAGMLMSHGGYLRKKLLEKGKVNNG